MIENYDLNDIVQMKKDHPCKKSHFWKITRMGFYRHDGKKRI